MSEQDTDRQKAEESKNDPDASSGVKASILFWVGTVIGLFVIYIITSILIKWLSVH